MTITLHQLALYAGSVAVLWMIPGPVWVALTARALSGGFASAWPLAIGVALGDLLWPLCAIFGLTWILSLYGDFLDGLKWVAAATFLVMGGLLIRKPATRPTMDSRMTRPGMWAGFAVGVAAVVGNPKAILFYMGVLPGFFDLTRVGGADIAAILIVSATIPALGNLGLALFLDRARRLISNAQSVARLNLISGVLLVCVAVAVVLL